MDQFKNTVPKASEQSPAFAVKGGQQDAQWVSSQGFGCGFSKSELEKGFDAASFDEAGGDLEMPVGRMATKRIDA